MRLKRLWRALGVVAAVLICSSVVAIGITSTGGDAYAAEADFVDEEVINDAYFLDSEVSFPKSTDIAYGDSVVSATEYTVTYPDGRVYDEKESFSLDQTGRYTISYFAKSGNKNIVARKNFNVVKDKYSISGSNSTITYPSDESNKLTLKMYDGETFSYNVPLKLENDGENSIIKFYLRQCDYTTSVDMTYLKVRLTDCYNSDVYVQFSLYCYAMDKYIHVFAQTGFSGTAYDNGLDTNKNATYMFEGTKYVIRNSGEYGRSMSNYSEKHMPLTFYYNPDTMRSYVASDGTDLFLVNALDNVDINGKKFGGFSTNEVYMSVFGSKYTSTSSEVDIYSIFGCDVSDLAAGEYVDTTAPVVDVDVVKTNDKGINAAIGEKVRIPEATAYDVNLKSVSYKVYYNYGTEYATLVNVKDGAFTPSVSGTYTIVYDGVDTFGNVGRETLNVYCLGGAEKGIVFTPAPVESLKAGERVTLPLPTISGINGDVSLKVRAYRDEDAIEYESEEMLFGSDGAIIGDGEISFVPLGGGEYTIEYSYGDNVNSYVLTTTVNCEKNTSDYYEFLEQPVLPKYLIENAVYELPSATAYSFVDKTPVTTSSQLYVKYDDGEFTAVTDASAFKVQKANKAYFVYRKGNAETQIYEAEIFSVGYGTKRLSIANYFKGDFTPTAQSVNIKFTANNGGNQTLSFINPVFTDKLVLSFYLSKTAKAKSVKISFADYYDAKSVDSFTLTESGESYSLVTNGGQKAIVNASLRSETTIMYNSESGKLILQDGGKMLYEFGGSGLCYLSIELIDAAAGDELYIGKVNNQAINNKAKDIFDSEVVVKDISGNYPKGTEIKLPVASFNDILSPVRYAECFVKVVYLGANGNETVVATDGTKLDGKANDVTKDYSFVLDKFGEYKAYYCGVLADGSVGTLDELRFSSICTQAPEISFNDGKGENITVEIKAGEKHQIRDFTAKSVKDGVLVNDDSNVYTIVIVYDSGLKMFSSGEDSFVATYADKYIVTVYCIDEYGNVATANYYVLAK